MGPKGIVRIIGGVAKTGSEIHTGQIGQYSLAIIVGTIIIILMQN